MLTATCLVDDGLQGFGLSGAVFLEEIVMNPFPLGQCLFWPILFSRKRAPATTLHMPQAYTLLLCPPGAQDIDHPLFMLHPLLSFISVPTDGTGFGRA